MIQGMRREVVAVQAHRLSIANPHLEYRPIQLNDGQWRIRVYTRSPRVSTGAIVSRIANIEGQERVNRMSGNYDCKSARTKGRSKLYGYYTAQKRPRS